MKAYRAVWLQMPEHVGIYIANTAARAKGVLWAVLQEMDYRARWNNLRATRAPEYDAWATRQPEHRRRIGVSEECVQAELRQALTS